MAGTLHSSHSMMLIVIFTATQVGCLEL